MGKILRVGSETVAAARDDYRIVMEARELTGLSGYRIGKIIDPLHGNVLLRNALKSEWPDIATIGAITVVRAQNWELVEEIAQITELSLPSVRKRLHNAHGNTLLAKLFDDRWPDTTAAAAADDSRELAESDDEEVSTRTRQAADRDDETGCVQLDSFSIQGGPEHKALQLKLCQLGQLSKHHVKTNKSIGSGVRPDVLWYLKDPEQERMAAALYVMEIERGPSAALQKSLAGLKHAHDLWPNVNLLIFVPRGRVEAAKIGIEGAFHDVAPRMRVYAIEDCIKLDLYALACQIGLMP